jgi:succinate dehydrogenase / fumarate reductase cytochrome b subunit
MSTRPLSPHLTVYRMSRYTLATSFFNRVTGVGLSAGLPLLVYWLVSVAGGSRAYGQAQRLFGLPLMRLVYAGLVVAFSYHLLAGLRHLVWDTGYALERSQSRRSAYLVVVLSIALMLLLAYGTWRAVVRAL